MTEENMKAFEFMVRLMGGELNLSRAENPEVYD